MHLHIMRSNGRHEGIRKVGVGDRGVSGGWEGEIEVCQEGGKGR